MNAGLVPIAPNESGVLSLVDATLTDEAQALIRISMAPNTQRAYQGWADRWDEWCAVAGRRPLPATGETLAAFVAVLAGEGKAPSSIAQAISAIRSMHDFAGYGDQPPRTEAKRVLQGYRRQWADQERRVRQAAPLTVDLLARVNATTGTSEAGDARDRAMLVVAFAGLLRRSNVVALNHADLDELRDRLRVTVRRSKTDQEARGRVVVLPMSDNESICPVRTVNAWREHCAEQGLTDGPLFRPVDRHGTISSSRLTAHSVSTIIARRAKWADLPVSQWTGHSLRSGGATSMAKEGATTSAIADHGGWSRKSPVVHEYVREREEWQSNPMRKVL